MEKYNIANLTPEDIARVRPIIMAYNSYIGRRLVFPVSSNLDLEYNKRVANGENCLRNPIKKYYLETVDLLGVLPVKMEHTGEIQIEFNGNPKLRFPLVKPDFQSVTTVSICEAIKKYEDTGEVTFYSDIDKAMNEIQAMNGSSIRLLDKYITEFSMMSTALRDITKIMRESQASYLQQLGVDNKDVEVTVSVETVNS